MSYGHSLTVDSKKNISNRLFRHNRSSDHFIIILFVRTKWLQQFVKMKWVNYASRLTHTYIYNETRVYSWQVFTWTLEENFRPKSGGKGERERIKWKACDTGFCRFCRRACCRASIHVYYLRSTRIVHATWYNFYNLFLVHETCNWIFSVPMISSLFHWIFGW